MVINFDVPDMLRTVGYCRRIADGMQHLCAPAKLPEERQQQEKSDRVKNKQATREVHARWMKNT